MGQTDHPKSRSQAVSCHLGLDASVFFTVCCPRAHLARLLALHMPKWVSGHIHAYSQQQHQLALRLRLKKYTGNSKTLKCRIAQVPSPLGEQLLPSVSSGFSGLAQGALPGPNLVSLKPSSRQPWPWPWPLPRGLGGG